MNIWGKCCKDENWECLFDWATWNPLMTLTEVAKGCGEDENQMQWFQEQMRREGLGAVRIESIFQKSYREEEQINGKIASANSCPPASSELCSWLCPSLAGKLSLTDQSLWVLTKVKSALPWLLSSPCSFQPNLLILCSCLQKLGSRVGLFHFVSVPVELFCK